jgi:hypothetical protein
VVVLLAEGEDADGATLLQFLLTLHRLDLLVLLQLQCQQVVPQDIVLADQSLEVAGVFEGVLMAHSHQVLQFPLLFIQQLPSHFDLPQRHPQLFP